MIGKGEHENRKHTVIKSIAEYVPRDVDKVKEENAVAERYFKEYANFDSGFVYKESPTLEAIGWIYDADLLVLKILRVP